MAISSWLTLDFHGGSQFTSRNCLEVEILLESKKEQIMPPPLAYLRGLWVWKAINWRSFFTKNVFPKHLQNLREITLYGEWLR